jgi:hypothetical protein
LFGERKGEFREERLLRGKSRDGSEHHIKRENTSKNQRIPVPMLFRMMPEPLELEV